MPEAPLPAFSQYSHILLLGSELAWRKSRLHLVSLVFSVSLHREPISFWDPRCLFAAKAGCRLARCNSLPLVATRCFRGGGNTLRHPRHRRRRHPGELRYREARRQRRHGPKPCIARAESFPDSDGARRQGHRLAGVRNAGCGSRSSGDAARRRILRLTPQLFWQPCRCAGEAAAPRSRRQGAGPRLRTRPHTASLGLAVYTPDLFPIRYRNGAFIGQHASWNRNPPSGYKMAFVAFRNGKPAGKPEDVLTGFLSRDGQALGRPVGVAVNRSGALLVADDVGDAVWRVTPAK